jgi:hypothetical protein
MNRLTMARQIWRMRRNLRIKLTMKEKRKHRPLWRIHRRLMMDWIKHNAESKN